MPSRRRLLSGLGTLVATAGCAAPTSRRRGSVCSASVETEAPATVFTLPPELTTYGRDDTPVVELTIPVRQSILTAEAVDLLLVREFGDLAYTIPVDPANDEPVGESGRYEFDDVVEYSQALGHLPQNGRFEVFAADSDGNELDQMDLDFRCYRQPPDG